MARLSRLLPPTTGALALLALAVLLIHWLLLHWAAQALGRINQPADTATIRFQVRTPPATPPATPQPAPPPSPPAPTPEPIAEPTVGAPPATEPPAPTAPAAEEPPATAPAAPTTSSSDTSMAPPDTNTPIEPPAPYAEEGHYAFPPPMRLHYEVHGSVDNGTYNGSAELTWQPYGAQYTADLAIKAWFITWRTQGSRGQLSPQGLEPERFSDKTKSRSEVATHFRRDVRRITFSNNQPDAELEAGAQDQLSVFVQLGALLSANPSRYPAGTTLSFQVADVHRAETWLFRMNEPTIETLPGGQLHLFKATREAMGDYGLKAEIWFSPELGFLPARIRLTQTNGDFIDMQWRRSTAL